MNINNKEKLYLSKVASDPASQAPLPFPPEGFMQGIIPYSESSPPPVASKAVGKAVRGAAPMK